MAARTMRHKWLLVAGPAEDRLDVASLASLCPRRDIMLGQTQIEWKCRVFLQLSSASGSKWSPVVLTVRNAHLQVPGVGTGPITKLEMYEVATPSSGSPALSSTSSSKKVVPGAGNPGKYVVGLIHEYWVGQDVVVVSTSSSTDFNMLRNILFTIRNGEIERINKERRIQQQRRGSAESSN